MFRLVLFALTMSSYCDFY